MTDDAYFDLPQALEALAAGKPRTVMVTAPEMEEGAFWVLDGDGTILLAPPGGFASHVKLLAEHASARRRTVRRRCQPPKVEGDVAAVTVVVRIPGGAPRVALLVSQDATEAVVRLWCARKTNGPVFTRHARRVPAAAVLREATRREIVLGHTT